MIRVLMIDDHEVLRDGLASVLGREPGIEVVASTGTAERGLELAEQLQPDVVTLDLSMPGMGGREAALSLLSGEKPPKVVVLSSEVSPDTVQSLLQIGVHGYVSKSAPSSDIVRAIKMVMEGQNYFSPDVTTALIKGSRGGAPPSLTLRQMEVLTAAAKGMTTREIADRLVVSPKTIEKYRGEIIARLEARNLVEAIDKARRLKLLE
jgi:two-component system invasion response regulator UvrY